jgi:G:T-mismatch repair DNA endonuclease (very short patch repair protein)/predicted nucleic acid-binding Zn ribbon protein
MEQKSQSQENETTLSGKCIVCGKSIKKSSSGVTRKTCSDECNRIRCSMVVRKRELTELSVTKDQLEEMYFIKKVSIPRIARELHVGVKRLCQLFRGYGIEIRTRGEATKEKWKNPEYRELVCRRTSEGLLERHYHPSEETRAKIRRAQCGRKRDPVSNLTRYRLSLANTKYQEEQGFCLVCGNEFWVKPYRRKKTCSEECCRSLHSKLSKRYLDIVKECPECGRNFYTVDGGVKEQIFCSHQCADIFNGRKRRGEIPWNKGLNRNNCDSIKALSESRRGQTKENCDRMRKVAESMIGHTHTEETKRILREIRRRQKFTRSSYPEKIINQFLVENGLSFKYVGDNSIHVGRYNPDFISQESRQIIEFNGCWFHGCPECFPVDQYPKLVEKYNKYNEKVVNYKGLKYEVLTIWYHDFERRIWKDMIFNFVKEKRL